MLTFTNFRLAGIFLLCWFLFDAAAYGQDKLWRPVSPQDLSTNSPVVEPDADAEALFWDVRIDDSSIDGLSMRHYVRVKIFTEKGRERFSKLDIPFANGQKIKDLEARVIKRDGAIVQIAKTDIFEREIIKAGGVKIKAKSFAVPNIEPGVIIEYRYREVIDDAGAGGMRPSFQRDIPVRELSYYFKTYGGKEPKYQNYNLSDTLFVKDQDGYWLARRLNVPAFKDEPQMPPDDTVRPWMMLSGTQLSITSLSGVGISFVVKDQSDSKKYWAAVAGQNAHLARFMNASNKEIKRVALEITAGATTPEEKLRKIYEFCQKEIRNTSYDTTLTDEDRKKLPGVKEMADVLKRKSASWRYIDWLFGSLATAAGFNARVALAGDRSKVFLVPEMADERLVHPAGVAVQVGADFRLFSPGRKFLPFGALPWNEDNTWALIVGEKDFGWQKTTMLDAAESLEKRTGQLRLLDDGTLEGDIRIELTGHPALTYRALNYNETDAKRAENVKNEITSRVTSAQVSDVVIENLNENTMPLVKKFKIRVPGYAQKTGKRMFLQPGFFEYGSTAIFSGPTRKYDVYFGYPWSENDSIAIRLPKGYTLDAAEAPAPLADGQKIGYLNITMTIDKVNNILGYERNFYFGSGGRVLFPAKSYEAVKRLFDAFYRADTHVITLKQT